MHFSFLTSYRIRRLYVLTRAYFIWKIHGINGIADYVYCCHSDYTRELLTRYGAKIGLPFYCKSLLQLEVSIYSRLTSFSNLAIGNNVFIGKNVYVDLTDKVIIEDEVSISPQVNILSHASVANRPLRKDFPEKVGPVVIKRGAWIGAGAIILCGIEIGENSVVGAGSVVTKSVPPFSIVMGVPAVIRGTLG